MKLNFLTKNQYPRKMSRITTIMKFFLNVVFGLVFLTWSFIGLAQSRTIELPSPATLSVMNRDIVVFRAPLNGASPEIRVENALTRMRQIEVKELSEEVSTVPFTLGKDKGYQIQLGPRHLFSIVENDLDVESDQQMEQLLEEVKTRLNELKQARYQQSRPGFLFHEALLVTLATIALFVAIWLTKEGLNWVGHKLIKKCHQISLQTDGVHWSEYIFMFSARLTQVISWLLVLSYLYFWATYSLSRFPLTYPLGHKLGLHVSDTLRWVVESLLGAIPDLITILIIVFMTRTFIDLLKVFFRRVQTGQLKIPYLHHETVAATQRITIVLIWCLSLAIIYPFIPGSKSDAFKGLSVIIGLVISLGSSGLVTQLMSGLVVVYSRALKVGDLIKVNGITGVVTEVGGLATKIQTQNQIETTIPNSVIIANSIDNFTKLNGTKGTVLSTTVTIGYDAPWRQIHDMLIASTHLIANIQQDPLPYVYQRALSDFYVEYQLFFHILDPKIQMVTLSEVHKKIQDEFNRAGIQIMSPHFNMQPHQPVLGKSN
jgi:small-conductance mechanosensitive channel